MNYDLEERTALFGEAVIRLCREVKTDAVTKPIIGQLIRSGTSIGANYMEANGASSKKDFAHKIFICKKETGSHYGNRNKRRDNRPSFCAIAFGQEKSYQSAQQGEPYQQFRKCN